MTTTQQAQYVRHLRRQVDTLKDLTTRRQSILADLQALAAQAPAALGSKTFADRLTDLAEQAADLADDIRFELP